LQWLREWAAGDRQADGGTSSDSLPADAHEQAPGARNVSGRHKRCKGTVTFQPGAGAEAVDHLLGVLVHVFLEKLTKGGRQDGFLDPTTTEGLGLMWATVTSDGNGNYSPLRASFYMRKGGARSITHSKRDMMRNRMLACEGIHDVSVQTIENELGDDLLPEIVTSGCEDQPRRVNVWPLDTKFQVAVNCASAAATTYYELGERRVRMQRIQPRRTPSASTDPVQVQEGQMTADQAPPPLPETPIRRDPAIYFPLSRGRVSVGASVVQAVHPNRGL